MKKQKLYVQSRGTLFCVNNIQEAEEVLPTPNQLVQHMIYERKLCENDPNRKPEPLAIAVKNTIFNSILWELKRKGYRSMDDDKIDLVVQSGNIPICVLSPVDNEIMDLIK